DHGSLPPAYNNMQVLDDGAGNIILVVYTNAPKNLAWRGGANATWDHTSTNWHDINAQALVTFSENDTVTFDDTAAVPTNITVSESVNPRLVPMTNSVNQFVFNNLGVGSIGGATLVKRGTQSLELDCLSSLSLQVNQGSVTGIGSVASISLASGASMNF